MNVELLTRVKEAILAAPQLLDMSDWNHPINCGTAHCIAGWACALDGWEMQSPINSCMITKPDNRNSDTEQVARDLLCLSSEQSDKLFYASRWLLDHKHPYYETKKGSQERAEITAKRIDHFIATEGAE